MSTFIFFALRRIRSFLERTHIVPSVDVRPLPDLHAAMEDRCRALMDSDLRTGAKSRNIAFTYGVRIKGARLEWHLLKL